MVSREANKRAAVKAKKKTPWVLPLLVFVIVAVVAFVIVRMMTPTEVEMDEGGCPTVDGTVIDSDECNGTGEVKKISRVDFQPVVDEWINSVGGNKGIIIYDLDLGEVVGEYNPDVRMRIESIYKLFVVYEGYRRVQNGTWNLNDACGYTGWTIGECLDKAIRDSSSAAAEAMHSMIGYNTLNETVHTDFNLPNVTVESIMATPREVMEMMKIFYNHAEITDANLVSMMKDSFLNQPPSAGYCSGLCDWRRGLPSGFSDKVNVYNKVGWLSNGTSWTYYCDAAILEFKEANRNYIAIVLTSNVSNKSIANFGTMIENYFFNTY